MRWKPIHGNPWPSWSSKVRSFLRDQSYPFESKWTDDLLEACLVLAGTDEAGEVRAVLWFNLVSTKLAELHLCVHADLHGRWFTPKTFTELVTILGAHGIEAVMCCPATPIHKAMARRVGFRDLGPLHLIELCPAPAPPKFPHPPQSPS